MAKYKTRVVLLFLIWVQTQIFLAALILFNLQIVAISIILVTLIVTNIMLYNAFFNFFKKQNEEIEDEKG